MTQGYFFKTLIEKRNDSEELVLKMEESVSSLLGFKTTISKPGMLLGKIQGGKTRAFIGIIALAFDNSYDVAIVLTKGTKALLKQTVRRFEKDYEKFIEDDQVKVFDIMNFPNNITQWELDQKIVIVVKKEINNMRTLIDNLVNTYPNLSYKKVLIVDDEADFASVSFYKAKDAVEVGKISSQIEELRRLVSDTDYLQVTATPYSLYLQPDAEGEDSIEFFPKRPRFTTLVPIHSFYVGGDFYFNETDAVAKYILEEFSTEEREALKKPDGRKFKIEDVLNTSYVKILRKAVMNFIVGVNIRRLQQIKSGEKPQKYAFVAHSEISIKSHDWQRQMIEEIIKKLGCAVKEDQEKLNQLIGESYEDLSASVKLLDSAMPSIDDVKKATYESIKTGQIMITVVNGEKEIEELLDEDGQLKLRTPINIYIGGQILDRGITIKNLIGFYYGRNPKKFQQDTVLQHSRMYGVRPKLDLVVTRFYTTHDIYEVMKKINEFDAALRDAFERGDHKNGVYFIRKDISGKLAPCSPSKLLLSSLTSLKPYKRLLPIGFQTDYKTKISTKIKTISEIIDTWFNDKNKENPILVDLKEIIKVIDLINETLVFDDSSYKWDHRAFVSSIEHLSLNSLGGNRGKVWVLARKKRNSKRIKEDGRYYDAPDTAKTEGLIAKEIAIDIPIIMLFQQNGNESDGWRGGPFWWPVMIAPRNTKTTIFASDTL
ncbi:MAG: Z1 domain-containing protein [Minisyncoccales bacterium]